MQTLRDSVHSVGLGIVGSVQLAIGDDTADFTLNRAWELGPYGQTTGGFHVGVEWSLAVAQACMKRALQLMAAQAFADMVRTLADAAGIGAAPMDLPGGCGVDPTDPTCFVAGTPVLVAATGFDPLIADGKEGVIGSGWYLVAAGIGIGLIVCEGGQKRRLSMRRRRRSDEFGLDDEFEFQALGDDDCENDRKLEEPLGNIDSEAEMSHAKINGEFVFEFNAANRLADSRSRIDAGSGVAISQPDTVASGDNCQPTAASPNQIIRWAAPVQTEDRRSAADRAKTQFNASAVRGLINPRRENAGSRSGWSRLRLTVGLLLAIAGVASGLWGSAHDVGRSDRPAAAAVHTSGPRHVAIENIRIGDRVLTNGPFGADAPSETAVNPSTWRHLRLEAISFAEDGTRDVAEIETLQSADWVAQYSAEVGATVPLPVDLVEMGFPDDLRGRVVSNEPCPPLQRGSGRIVLMTVNHLNRNVIELTLQSQDGRKEKLRPTAFHKFYSDSRSEWVSAEDLCDGERLRGSSGPVTVAGRTRIPGIHRVYNMTVEAEHVYRVSKLGVLVHNQQCGAPGVGGPMTADQVALKDLVDEATHGGRAPLSAADANSVLDWADETDYPGWRAGPSDVGNPSNWPGGDNKPHIHIPGVGSGHIPVGPGVSPR